MIPRQLEVSHRFLACHVFTLIMVFFICLSIYFIVIVSYTHLDVYKRQVFIEMAHRSTVGELVNKLIRLDIA